MLTRINNFVLFILGFIFFIAYQVECAPEYHKSSKPAPIILVPGDGGSQFQAKLNKPDVVHYFCTRKTSHYIDLWLNLEYMIPLALDCWVDNMRLVYDNETRTTTNSPGVDIKIPGFGNTSTVEWLDPSHVHISAYYYDIVNKLVSSSSKYIRGVNIRGAPYDFRKAPNELSEYYKDLKELIEETYRINKNSKVIVICHSLGCPVSLYFFNHLPSVWKTKYIKSLISLSAAWGGAVKAFKAFASGDNLGVHLINALTVRGEERTNPSTAFLMPSDNFWEPDEILAYTPNRNYSISNYHEFFQDIQFDVGWEMWKDTNKLIHNFTSPGIEVHCLHGINMPTISQFYYEDMEDFPDYPKYVHGDGDGTVNLRSLRGCLKWPNVYHVEYNEVDHMDILKQQSVLEYIHNLAFGN